MNFISLLIILGCLAGGYWLVSSIMGSGVDLTRGNHGKDSSTQDAELESGARAHEGDWHLILDVPVNASRREIDAAYKRRVSKAENSGDAFEATRIRRAYAAATRRSR